ncbi:MAG: gluconokinase [Brachymonas sp.]
MTCIVVMGVAGCGKSTFGQELAIELNLPWIEGDDCHSAASKAKMAAGTPLMDADREGWLLTLCEQMRKNPAGCVIGCSALKRSYRDTLRQAGYVRFAYLRLTREEAQRRVSSRAGHFFSDTLVSSQFAALEDPSQEPGVIALDATEATTALVRQVRVALQSAMDQVK